MKCLLQIWRPFKGQWQSPFPMSPLDQDWLCLCVNKSSYAHSEDTRMCRYIWLVICRVWYFPCAAEHQKWPRWHHLPAGRCCCPLGQEPAVFRSSAAGSWWLHLAKLRIHTETSRTFPKHVTEARSLAGGGAVKMSRVIRTGSAHTEYDKSMFSLSPARHSLRARGVCSSPTPCHTFPACQMSLGWCIFAHMRGRFEFTLLLEKPCCFSLGT